MRYRIRFANVQTTLTGGSQAHRGHNFNARYSLVNLLNRDNGMPSINSLKMIERKIEELRAKAKEIRRDEQKGVEELRAVIAKYKLGYAHCKMAMRGVGAERNARTRAKGKMEPKYRSLYNEALVWSGRGRKPSWIVSGLKSGRKLDDFLIEGNHDEASGPASAVPSAVANGVLSVNKSNPTSGCELSVRADVERE